MQETVRLNLIPKYKIKQVVKFLIGLITTVLYARINM